MEQGGERGLPGGLPDTQALGLGWVGNSEVGFYFGLPQKQPLISGFECNLLLWEGKEAPAAGERGGEPGREDRQ